MSCPVRSFAVALALAGSAWPASGQATSGIDGIVVDTAGGAISHARITLATPASAEQTTVSDLEGRFRFVSLPDGTYTVTTTAAGFETATHTVVVSGGATVSLRVPLPFPATRDLPIAPAPTTEAVRDEPRRGPPVTVIDDSSAVLPDNPSRTTVTREELERIPGAGDVFTILRALPGILVDRVNVGGSENGRQAALVGMGAQGRDTTWTYDGVVITDMTGPGGSPSFYDLDALDEITVSRAANDVTVATGGIAVALEPKSGSNAFHGTAHASGTTRGMSFFNLPPELYTDPRLARPDGTFSSEADQIDQNVTYGAEVGGPLIHDTLWFWGAYDRQDVRLVSLGQRRERSVLNVVNARLDWAPTEADHASLAYFVGDRTRHDLPGVGAAFGLREDASALWDERPAAPGAVRGLLSARLQHVFRPQLVGTVRYAYFGDGSVLADRGAPLSDDFIDDVARGNVSSRKVHAQHALDLAVDYAPGAHQLRFGFGYRRYPVNSTTSLPADKIWSRLNTSSSSGFALVTRDRVARFVGQYLSGYASDTITRDRLTLTLGVRADFQESTTAASVATANPVFPELLPTARFPGADGASWKDLSPRVSAAYALTADRKTVLRASYARYAGQLAANEGAYTAVPAVSYLAYYWIDSNHDHVAQRDEILTNLGVTYSGYVDPASPGTADPGRTGIAPGFGANHDDEASFGLERELATALSARGGVTWRRSTDLAWAPLAGFTTDDYSCRAPVSAAGYSAFVCDPSPTDLLGSAAVIANRPQVHLTYWGAEVDVVKRLENRWMARIGLSWNDWTQHFDGPLGIVDPTPTQTNPLVDGGVVAPQSALGKPGVFLNARWQLSASGLYQLPLGFELAAAFFARQGYPQPIVLRLDPVPEDGAKLALATDALDSLRYGRVTELDLRLAKTVRLGGRRSATISLDGFNILGQNPALQRSTSANSLAFGRLEELMAPRVLRVNARVAF